MTRKEIMNNLPKIKNENHITKNKVARIFTYSLIMLFAFSMLFSVAIVGTFSTSVFDGNANVANAVGTYWGSNITTNNNVTKAGDDTLMPFGFANNDDAYVNTGGSTYYGNVSNGDYWMYYTKPSFINVRNQVNDSFWFNPSIAEIIQNQGNISLNNFTSHFGVAGPLNGGAGNNNGIDANGTDYYVQSLDHDGLDKMYLKLKGWRLAGYDDSGYSKWSYMYTYVKVPGTSQQTFKVKASAQVWQTNNYSNAYRTNLVMKKGNKDLTNNGPLAINDTTTQENSTYTYWDGSGESVKETGEILVNGGEWLKIAIATNCKTENGNFNMTAENLQLKFDGMWDALFQKDASNNYLIANQTDYDYLKFMVENKYDSTNLPFLQTASSVVATSSLGNFANPFKGIYNANGNKIVANINDTSTNHVGVFGYVSGATISNLNVEGSVSGKNYVGGIVGFAENSQIVNCNNSATVLGTENSVGGIAGKALDSTITNVKNNGNVTGVSKIGGVFGEIFLSSISGNVNSSNMATIVATGNFVGGIVGFAENSNIGQNINDVIVNDSALDFSSKTLSYVGGIVGKAIQTNVAHARNNAVVSSQDYIGGIVGGIDESAPKSSIETTQNYGAISGRNYIGGIVGGGTSFDVAQAENVGTILATGTKVGGIVGGGNNVEFSSTIQSKGSISSTGTRIGGIVGELFNGTIRGKVTVFDVAKITFSSNEIGGIVGYAENSNIGQNAGDVIENYASLNNKTISFVGGIVGKAVNTNIANCTNHASILGQNHIGGVVGNIVGVKNGDNFTHTLSAKNNGSVGGTNYVGGVAGYAETVNIKSENTGNVKAINFVAGICGFGSDLKIFDTTNLGSVSAHQYVGGILGAVGKDVDGTQKFATDVSTTVLGVLVSNTTNGATNTTAKISTETNCVGGIVGYAISNSTISGTNHMQICGELGTEKFDCVGGIVGYAKNITISGLNYGTIVGKNFLGGIVGYAELSKIQNVQVTTKTQNFGSINTVGNFVGGIVGYSFSNSSVTATNTGEIAGGKYVGGVAGLSYGSTILQSENFANIAGNGYVGGIVGCVGKVENLVVTLASDQLAKTEIRDCSNGDGLTSNTVLSTENFVGGIVGYGYGLIENSNNFLKVEAKKVETNVENFFDYVGGISGTQIFGEILNSVNHGSVFGKDYVGGISGNNFVNLGATSKGVSNKGSISGNFYVGGISGKNETATTVFVGSNQNGVLGKKFVGGVFGFANGGTLEAVNNDSSIKFEVSAIQDAGVVDSGNYVGGVVGYAQNSLIKNSFATSNMMVTGNQYVGGIVGILKNGTVTADDGLQTSNNCKVSGSQFVGGIVGFATSSSITNSSNALGAVISVSLNANGNYFGGIVGCSEESTVALVSNAGNVSANNFVGGIVGLISGISANLTPLAVVAENNGAIFGVENVGGIAGAVGKIVNSEVEFQANIAKVNFENCKNQKIGNSTNSIQGSTNVGGIVGKILAGSVLTCQNFLSIVGKTNVGGIVGNIVAGSVSGENRGNISGTDHIGGLIGISSETKLANLQNFGGVEGVSFVGGVVGEVANTVSTTESIKTIEQVKNGSVASHGHIVKGKDFVGGIFGHVAHAFLNGQIANGESTIQNYGEIQSLGGSTGGIVGVLDGKSQINFALNFGTIKLIEEYTTFGATLGGIVGRLNSSGDVSYQSKVTFCKNEGSIYGMYATGGIVGVVEANTQVANCKNQAGIVGSSIVSQSSMHAFGGIVGIVLKGSSNQIVSCYSVLSETNRIGSGLALNVGGILGLHQERIAITNLIVNCFVVGYENMDSGAGGSKGGIVGVDMSTVLDNSQPAKIVQKSWAITQQTAHPTGFVAPCVQNGIYLLVLNSAKYALKIGADNVENNFAQFESSTFNDGNSLTVATLVDFAFSISLNTAETDGFMVLKCLFDESKIVETTSISSSINETTRAISTVNGKISIAQTQCFKLVLGFDWVVEKASINNKNTGYKVNHNIYNAQNQSMNQIDFGGGALGEGKTYHLNNYFDGVSNTYDFSKHLVFKAYNDGTQIVDDGSGAITTGGAPKFVQRDESNLVKPYYVTVNIVRNGVIVGFANVRYYILAMPVKITGNVKHNFAYAVKYEYNGSHQVYKVGLELNLGQNDSMVIGNAMNDDLDYSFYAGLTENSINNYKVILERDYADRLVYATAKPMYFNEKLTVNTSGNATWNSKEQLLIDLFDTGWKDLLTYVVPSQGGTNNDNLDFAFKDAGTYIMHIEGKLSGVSGKNYQQYEIKRETPFYEKVSMYKKSISANELISQFASTNGQIGLDLQKVSQTEYQLNMFKHYDNMLYSSPEMMNGITESLHKKLRKYGGFYLGDDQFENIFDIKYEWSNILPDSPNLMLKFIVKINDVVAVRKYTDEDYSEGGYVEEKHKYFLNSSLSNFNFGYGAETVEGGASLPNLKSDYTSIMFEIDSTGKIVISYSKDSVEYEKGDGVFAYVPKDSYVENSSLSFVALSKEINFNVGILNAQNTVDFFNVTSLKTQIKNVEFGYFLKNIGSETQQTAEFNAKEMAADRSDLGIVDMSKAWGGENNPYLIESELQLQMLADIVNGSFMLDGVLCNLDDVKNILFAGKYGINLYRSKVMVDSSTTDIEQLLFGYRTESIVGHSTNYFEASFFLKQNIGNKTSKFQFKNNLPIGLYYGVDDVKNRPFSGNFNANNLQMIEDPTQEGAVAVDGEIVVYYDSIANGTNSLGFVGYLKDGSVTNIKLIGNIAGNGMNNVGAIVGIAENASIKYVANYADVVGNDNVGGIVGTFVGSTDKKVPTILHSENYSNVTGQNAVGGIVGKAYNEFVIEKTFSHKDDAAGSSMNGGAGVQEGVTPTLVKIESLVGNAGGIVGEVEEFVGQTKTSKIRNSLNYTKIVAEQNAGGIVGKLAGKSQVSMCFNESPVIGGISAGLIVGFNEGSSANVNVVTILNCYSMSYLSNEISGNKLASLKSEGSNIFGSTGLAKGGIIGARNETNSPRIAFSWAIVNFSKINWQKLGYNTGSYNNGNYNNGKFIFVEIVDIGVDIALHIANQMEWRAVIGNIEVGTNLNETQRKNLKRSATSFYANQNGIIAPNQLPFKLQSASGYYSTVTLYNQNSTYDNAKIYRYDVNMELKDAGATAEQTNKTPLICMYIDASLETQNLTVGFGKVAADRELMYKGDKPFDDAELLKVMSNPSYSSESPYYKISSLARRSYVVSKRQVGAGGETTGNAIYQTGATVKFDLKIFYHYPGSTKFETDDSGITQEGIFIGYATLTKTIVPLRFIFEADNFVFKTDSTLNVLGDDNLSKYYDNNEKYHATIEQQPKTITTDQGTQVNEARYPAAVKDQDIRNSFDSLNIEILQGSSTKFPHFALSAEKWGNVDNVASFESLNHNNTFTGLTKAVGENLFVWFCVKIEVKLNFEYQISTISDTQFKEDKFDEQGTKIGETLYLWMVTKSPQSKILPRPIKVTPKSISKNYDGLPHNTNGANGETVFGEASHFDYMVLNSYTTDNANLDFNFIGNFGIEETSQNNVGGILGDAIWTYATSTGSVMQGKHADGKAIYMPGRYRYTIGSFTVESEKAQIEFNNGFDETSKVWTPFSNGSNCFEIKGSLKEDYGTLVDNDTYYSQSGAQKAVYFDAPSLPEAGSVYSSQLVRTNDTLNFRKAFHSDLDDASGKYGVQFGYGNGTQQFDYRTVHYGIFRESSGYGYDTTYTSVTIWLDLYFSPALLKAAESGLLSIRVMSNCYTGYNDDHNYVGLGSIGVSDYPQTCTGTENATNGMETYSYNKGDIVNEAATYFVKPNTRGVRVMFRNVAAGDMTYVLNHLQLEFSKGFHEATKNDLFIGPAGNHADTIANDSKTFHFNNSDTIGYWNWIASENLIAKNNGNGFDTQNSNNGKKAMMGVNIRISKAYTSSSYWNDNNALMRLTLSANTTNSGYKDSCVMAIKAGKTTKDGNANIAADSAAMKWNGKYLTNRTQDVNGDNMTLYNALMTKSLLDEQGGCDQNGDYWITVIFDIEADGGFGYQVNNFTLNWEWVLPHEVNEQLATSASKTYAFPGGSSSSNNELYQMYDQGQYFYVGADHTKIHAVKKCNNYAVWVPEAPYGLGFNTWDSTEALLMFSFDLTRVANALQAKGDKLSNYNLNLQYRCEDESMRVVSTPDKAAVSIYSGMPYGAYTSIDSTTNFGVDLNKYPKLGYEEADTMQDHNIISSLSMLEGNIFTMFIHFTPRGDLDWFFANIVLKLEKGGVALSRNTLTAYESEDTSGNKNVQLGYYQRDAETNLINYSYKTDIANNAVSLASFGTPNAKIGFEAQNPQQFFWGSAKQTIGVDPTYGVGFNYGTGTSGAGYAQMGVNLEIDESLLQYAYDGRLRISYEAIVHAPTSGNSITSGIYRYGMMETNQFSPMVDENKAITSRMTTQSVAGENLKFYSYNYYPRVSKNQSGGYEEMLENGILSQDGIDKYYFGENNPDNGRWFFSVFFQDTATSNGLQMRIKNFNIKIEVTDEAFEYDGDSFKDVSESISMTANEKANDCYIFDTRSIFYAGTKELNYGVNSTTDLVYKDSTKAVGFFNLKDRTWLFGSKSKEAELTHSTVDFGNVFGSDYQNAIEQIRYKSIGVGLENGANDVLTDTIENGFGGRYQFVQEDVTFGVNVQLTDRLWTILQEGNAKGINISFDWLGLPNLRNATIGQESINLGGSTFTAGWSKTLFNVSNSKFAGTDAGASGSPYNAPQRIDSISVGTNGLCGAELPNYNDATHLLVQNAPQSSGRVDTAKCINQKGVAMFVSKETLALAFAGSYESKNPRQFSVFFNVSGGLARMMYISNLKIELSPQSGENVDSETSEPGIVLNPETLQQPTEVSTTPEILNAKLVATEKYNPIDSGFDFSINDVKNSNGVGFPASMNNYYYNSKFYSQATGESSAYTKYKVTMEDNGSLMWNFNLWATGEYVQKTPKELKKYAGARFSLRNGEYVYDENGVFVPVSLFNAISSSYLKDWSRQTEENSSSSNEIITNLGWAISHRIGDVENYVETFTAYYTCDFGDKGVVNITAKWQKTSNELVGKPKQFSNLELVVISNVKELEIVGFDGFGNHSSILKLAPERYDKTAMEVKINQVSNANYDEKTLDLSSKTNVSQNWMKPGDSKLVISTFEKGEMNSSVAADYASGIGLILPLVMKKHLDGYYYWGIDTQSEETGLFKGNWQYYLNGTWKNLDVLNNGNWIDTAINTSTYNGDFYDIDGYNGVSAEEIQKQWYLMDVYKLTKYFNTVVRNNMAGTDSEGVNKLSVIESGVPGDANYSISKGYRIRYVRDLQENTTFHFGVFDAAGNSSNNSIVSQKLLLNRMFKNNYGIDSVVDSLRKSTWGGTIGNPSDMANQNFTGYNVNVDHLYQETINLIAKNKYGVEKQIDNRSYVVSMTDKTEKERANSFYDISKDFTQSKIDGFVFMGWQLLQETRTDDVADVYLNGKIGEPIQIRKLLDANKTAVKYSTYFYESDVSKFEPNKIVRGDLGNQSISRLMPIEQQSNVSVSLVACFAPVILNVAGTEINETIKEQSKTYDGNDTQISISKIPNLAGVKYNEDVNYYGVVLPSATDIMTSNPATAGVDTRLDIANNAIKNALAQVNLNVAVLKNVLVTSGNADYYELIYSFSSTYNEAGISYTMNLGNRTFKFKIEKRLITSTSWGNSSPSLTYNGDYVGIKGDFKNIMSKDDAKLRFTISGIGSNQKFYPNKATSYVQGQEYFLNNGINYFEAVNAGTYDFKAKLTDIQNSNGATSYPNANYSMNEISKTFTVQKAQITNAYLNDSNVVYNGKTYYLNLSNTSSSDSKTSITPSSEFALEYSNIFANGTNKRDYGNVKYTYVSGNAVNVGKYSINVRIENDNYETKNLSAVLTIHKAVFNIVQSASKISKVYDATTAVTTNLVLGQHYNVVFDSSIYNSSWYDGETSSPSVSLSASNFAYADKNVGSNKKILGLASLANSNYQLSNSGQIEFVGDITKKSLSLSWSPQNVSEVYNGQYKKITFKFTGGITNEKIEISISFATTRDWMNLKFENEILETSPVTKFISDSVLYDLSALNCGEATFTISMARDSASNSNQNYEMTSQSGKIAISQQVVTSVVWNGLDKTLVYNGFAQDNELSATAMLGGKQRNLVLNFKKNFGTTNMNVFKDATIYTVTCSVKNEIDGEYNSQNFIIGSTVKATATINKLMVSLTWSGNNYVVYTGSVIDISLTFKATVSNKANFGDVVNIVYSGNTATNANINGYTMTVASLSGSSADNYTLDGVGNSVLKKTWYISPATVNVSNVSLSKEYDGTTSYAGAFENGVHYKLTSNASIPLGMSISFNSIEFSGNLVGTYNVTMYGLKTSNPNFTIENQVTAINAGTIVSRNLEISLLIQNISKIYDMSSLLASYKNADGVLENEFFALRKGIESGSLPANLIGGDKFVITASFVDTMDIPQGVSNGTFDSYVNQRDKFYYKKLKFSLTSVDESHLNYTLTVKDVSSLAGTEVVIDDSRNGDGVNNKLYTFEIVPISLNGKYLNTMQSYRAPGGVANTNWNDVVFTTTNASFKKDEVAGNVRVAISQGWKRGYDGISGIYTGYSVIKGNTINDVQPDWFDGTEDLLKLTIYGATKNANHCAYNYNLITPQPVLVIGYFISDDEGAKVDSLAALMLVGAYYANGDYDSFTMTTDISGILTQEDIDELVKSGEPGIKEYLEKCDLNSKVNFIPIGVDFFGNFVTEFNGKFNGAGFVITDLNITSASFENANVGLFAVVGKDGMVLNVHLRDAEILRVASKGNNDFKPNSNVGGLVGLNKGSIQNSTFEGNITIPQTFAGNVLKVGGIAGANYGTLEGIVAVGNISAYSQVVYAGGIVGEHAYSYTENYYLYATDKPTKPTETISRNENKIANSISFVNVLAQGKFGELSSAGAIVGRVVTASGEVEKKNSGYVANYQVSNFANANLDTLVIDTSMTHYVCDYLQNSVLLQTIDDLFATSDWVVQNKRVGTSEQKIAGKLYYEMRKLGDNQVENAFNDTANGFYETYLRFIAKGKVGETASPLFDDMYYVLVEIVDVYVLSPDKIGKDESFARYRYAIQKQKKYEKFWFDKDAKGGPTVYPYGEKDKAAMGFPVVYLYDESCYTSLYARKTENGVASFITLGELLELADPTNQNYWVIGGKKYLNQNVGLFAKYTTFTGAKYVDDSGKTIDGTIKLNLSGNQLSVLGEFRFADFTILFNSQISSMFEGGFQGRLFGGVVGAKVKIKKVGIAKLFEFENSQMYDLTTIEFV